VPGEGIEPSCVQPRRPASAELPAARLDLEGLALNGASDLHRRPAQHLRRELEVPLVAPHGGVERDALVRRDADAEVRRSALRHAELAEGDSSGNQVSAHSEAPLSCRPRIAVCAIRERPGRLPPCGSAAANPAARDTQSRCRRFLPAPLAAATGTLARRQRFLLAW